MSDPNEGGKQPNFQEPPDVKVIEASCKQSTQKTSDNGTWTTVLKNPITINKGDEIRAVASYIDCPGIDQEIIQFTRSGQEQDNTHTLLTQMYTVNDGFQQKTASYDYMCRPGFLTINPGGPEANPPYTFPAALPAGVGVELRTFNEDGTAAGLGCFCDNYTLGDEMLVRANVIDGGSGYENGDGVTWTGSSSKVVFMVDGQGAVKSTHIVANGPNTVQANIIGHTRNQNAAGANIVYHYTSNGGAAADKVLVGENLRPLVTQPLGGPNGEYRPGQIAQVWLTPNTAAPVANYPVNTGATVRINNVYKGNPGASSFAAAADLPSYFDQGYNYQRTPLHRWAQTYENTSKFCYGRGYHRKYTASDDIEYDLNVPSKLNQNDLLLSAAMICRNKEDEFVSGIFHKSQGSATTLASGPYQFNNYRTAVELTALNSEFMVGRESGLNLKPEYGTNLGIGRITIASRTKKIFPDSNLPLTVQNQTEIDYFINSILCPGMVVDIRFKMDIPEGDARDTVANQWLVYTEFTHKWGGVFPIGSQETVEGPTGVKYMRNFIGPPAKFDPSGSTDLGGGDTYENYNKGAPTDIEFGHWVDGDTGLGIGQEGATFLCKLDESPIAGMTAGQAQFPGEPTFVDDYIQVECNTYGAVGSPDNPAGPNQKVPGAIKDVYFQAANLLPTRGWSVGQSLKSIAPGEIPPVGATGNALSAATQAVRLIITTTDPCGGADFGVYDTLEQGAMTITGGIPVKMIITPVPYYMSGLQTFSDTGSKQVNANGFSCQRVSANPVLYNGNNIPVSQGGQSFDNYAGMYPPTFPECFHLNRANPGGQDQPYRSANPNCLLYKPAGLSKDEETDDYNKVYSFHDKDQELEVSNMVSGNAWGNERSYNFTVGPNAAAGGDHIIQASAVIDGGQYAQPTFRFNLPAITATYPELEQLDDLPIHTLMVLNRGLNNERHVMMGGVGTEITPNTIYEFKVQSRCVPQTQYYGFTLPNSMANITSRVMASNSTGYGFPDIDTTGTHVNVSWIKRPNEVNNGFITTFTDKIKGSIAYTSSQNFYGSTDPNLNTSKLLAFDNWKYIMSSNGISQQGISSYDKGGFYFLTQNTGLVSASSERVQYRKFFGFSQGYGEFVLYNGDAASVPIVNQASRVYNNKLPYLSDPFAATPLITWAMANNATDIYGYEPLYNQRSFVMDRNFVVPSDIASKWDAQSHKILPIIDRDTGEQLTSTRETGLIQNEFIHPVYGSNNAIDSGGEYIKDLTLFPNSGGLQGGHCIGVAFIDQNQEWLNKNLVPYMPGWYGAVSPSENSNGNLIHYKVYFRTPFTQLRNYDPSKIQLKTASDYHPGMAGQIGIPDRTPLHTLQTQARNIGNTSRIAAAQVAPQPNIPAKTVTLIDGTTMSFTEDPSQTSNPHATGATAAQYDPTKNPNAAIISELMETPPNQTDHGPNTGIQPHVVTPAGYTGGSSTNFPDSPFAYPVRYVENTTDGKFDRALASQFCGTTNPTLAFQTDTSAFTFQFFYQPYTSPFLDGSGGDLATRIFYGNRKEGIYNHDSFGGIVVWNWARPNYPRGVMNQSDIANPELNAYPNGINPFTSVAVIGKRFLNKLGFSDNDLDITFDNRVNSFNPIHTGFTVEGYQKDYIMDGGQIKNIASVNIVFKGTNFSLIDSSDAILSAIDAPENSASLHTHNTLAISAMGINNNIMRQMNGDYIFYPYSLSSSTDSFQASSASVRFDNCTDAYGSVGGLRLSNVGRGMGLPNTQGSTSIVDQKSIPVTLNVDCNLYLSYSAATPNSNLIEASGLPKKMNHGHLIVISSLLEEPNFIMSKVGAINGISLISKAFLTGDFILSNGMLSWFAKKDRVISEITTRIVNTNYETPTVLGDNSTVVYSITNNQPKPMDRPNTIFEIQQNDYEIMGVINQHLGAVGQGIGSPLNQLESQLDNLGIGIIENGDTNKSANLISELRNQINAFGLNRLNPTERREFFQTPAGAAFIQNATAMRRIMTNLRQSEQDQMNINDGLGDDALIAQHNRNIRRVAIDLNREGEAARQRLAGVPYVIPPEARADPEFIREPPIPDADPRDVVRRTGAGGADDDPRFSFLQQTVPIQGAVGDVPFEINRVMGENVSSIAASVGSQKDDPESGLGTSIHTRTSTRASQPESDDEEIDDDDSGAGATRPDDDDDDDSGGGSMGPGPGPGGGGLGGAQGGFDPDEDDDDDRGGGPGGGRGGGRVASGAASGVAGGFLRPYNGHPEGSKEFDDFARLWKHDRLTPIPTDSTVESVYRYDLRGPDDILQNGIGGTRSAAIQDAGGQGIKFGSGLKNALFLGNTIYTAETREGAERYLDEKKRDAKFQAGKENPDRDDHWGTKFTAHLYKINSVGYETIKYEGQGEDFHKIAATYNNDDYLVGNSSPDKIRESKRYQGGKAKFNKEIQVKGPVAPRHIEYLGSSSFNLGDKVRPDPEIYGENPSAGSVVLDEIKQHVDSIADDPTSAQKMTIAHGPWQRPDNPSKKVNRLRGKGWFNKMDVLQPGELARRKERRGPAETRTRGAIPQSIMEDIPPYRQPPPVTPPGSPQANRDAVLRSNRRVYVPSPPPSPQQGRASGGGAKDD